MRLSKIKLAGFKSFVDPTTIDFPSNLSGIVGPNGCGKSNVIDAVRWVMGESSAKHLRGDTMADVIFNGSSSRKPVGHATIELVFDNSEGKVGGQYANYSEIAIKRVVGRDGQSNYYLNGGRCRRKDITDIFLGTGLGPRSYAVIEQGMISRFIEAKPEEMRNFLEEAAGISKYKERRRETENRIRHTRDNLDRINDLRDELDNQLKRLDRQAKVAERYKKLKQEERQLKAELLALRWKAAHEQAQSHNEKIKEKETKYEAQIADQRRFEAEIEHKRSEHNDASDEFNKIQARYYQQDSDIARIDQSIQHNREKRQQLKLDLEQADAALIQAQNNLDTDQQRINELTASLKDLEPALVEAREKEKQSAAVRSRIEEEMQDWQIEWEDLNTESSVPLRTAEVEHTRIQHLEQQLAHLKDRIQRLENEHTGLTDNHESDIKSLDSRIEDASGVVNRLQQEIDDRQKRIQDQREINHDISETLDETRSALQTQRGRLSSLEALQESALGKRQEEVVQWLEERGLKQAQRLAEGIHAREGWEHAVETVLGFHLEAVCVDDINSLAGAVAQLKHGTISIYETSASPQQTQSRTLGTPLSQYVDTDWSIASLLDGVYAVDSLNEAMSLREKLASDESVITPEGLWLGKNWLRLSRDSDDKAGVLQREQEINQLENDISVAEKSVTDLQRRLDDGKEQLRALEDEREAKQAALSEAGKQYAELKAMLSASQASLEHIKNEKERIQVDVGEMLSHLQTGEQELAEAREKLHTAKNAIEIYEKQRSELEDRRDHLRDRLDDARETAEQDHDEAHQLAIRVESSRTAMDSTQQAIARIHEQVEQLQTRKSDIITVLEEGNRPVEELEQERSELLAKKLETEKELKEARVHMEEIGQAIELLTQNRNEAEQTAQTMRTELEEERMEFKAIDVRCQTIQEQISESGMQHDSLLEQLDENATVDEWQQNVEKMEQRINRLGPINLAAIDEFTEMSERKEYLDSQMNDLESSLTTLENAIKKIDKETRHRFKETFEKVNNKLKETFPKLFGGGSAYLEMESDDLLNSGVMLLARPPGKRLSNIHLMSGGEKALTAVAMIFSIFELNPAPFCLLDEVDAPLDDANVGRFCDLVKDMSERVQFIFISHNKLTMEIANHLMGVTMHEPGVSRLVAVDMDEAAAMAAM